MIRPRRERSARVLRTRPYWRLLGLILVLAPTRELRPEEAGTKPEDGWRLQRREATIPLDGVTEVVIVNRAGGVLVKPVSGTTGTAASLLITNHQTLGTDPDHGELPYRLSADDGRLEIEVPAPAAPDKPERLDLSLLLPAHLSLSITTADGAVEVNGFSGPVAVVTGRGDVRIATSGPLQVTTEHGEVHAEFRSIDPQAADRIETVNGSIRVVLPQRASVRALVSTRGELSTDFSIVLSRHPATGEKQAIATIGLGEASLVVRSVNGAVRLQESFLAP